ncbi:MAG: hypothetical protein PHN49_11880 [Candidatus Omnitrophica bacterium]|nr:hypothetical protein [Candidatus Omnitrophota bacterium]MDD5672326.1 hypothetical protein [Candidatus Omnitrophota bacterium]
MRRPVFIASFLLSGLLIYGGEVRAETEVSLKETLTKISFRLKNIEKQLDVVQQGITDIAKQQQTMEEKNSEEHAQIRKWIRRG